MTVPAEFTVKSQHQLAGHVSESSWTEITDHLSEIYILFNCSSPFDIDYDCFLKYPLAHDSMALHSHRCSIASLDTVSPTHRLILLPSNFRSYSSLRLSPRPFFFFKLIFSLSKLIDAQVFNHVERDIF